MIGAAAICPHPPGLPPQVGVGLPEMDPVRCAAHEAVTSLVAWQPQRIFIFGPDDVHVAEDESAGGSFSGFGCAVHVGGARLVLPPAYAVAAWLLDEVGWQGRRRYLSHREHEPGSGQPSIRDAVLVMADGDTSAGVSAATHAHPRFVEQAELIAAALERGDAASLAALDAESARQFDGTGFAPLRHLGRAWIADGGTRTDAATEAQATLLYDASPFGVRYWVASWRAKYSGLG